MTKINTGFQLFMMLFWALMLTEADSYYAPYFVVAILSFLCFWINYKKGCWAKSNKKNIFIGVCAVFFSLMVTLSNYSLYSIANWPEGAGSVFKSLYQLSQFLLLFLGGFYIAWNILYFLSCLSTDFVLKGRSASQKRGVPIAILGIPFIIISLINITLLFTCKYPGNLSPDSIAQINQIMSGSYTNHHPFYHTMVIRVFLIFGMKIFGNMNAAAACYHVFQIMFMAACFSLVIFTLYEMKVPFKILGIITCYYALMPFHIMYSFTMWKDVMFSGFFTAFIIFAYRSLLKIGKSQMINLLLLLVSGVGVCLFRSNGVFIFLAALITFIVLFGKQRKKMLILLLGVAIISFLLKNPLLDRWGVKQTEVVEALSVPAQQIARVAVDYDDFTDGQRDLLSRVIEIEKIPEYYTSYISDPIKALIRFSGNQEYIVEHKFEFAKLYIQVGLKHPLAYVKAWVDETRGFWNAGYAYWRWTDDIYENEYGIKKIVNSESINNFCNTYLWVFANNSFLQLFLCIGFYVWFCFLLCFICVIRHDKIGLFTLVPVLGLILSLVISTPVYAEFRYAYPIMCAIPFLIMIVWTRGAIVDAEEISD